VNEFRAPRIELLGTQHDRSSFTCGVPELNDYFKNQAGQDARRSVTRVYVAIDDITDTIVGFYTLSATSIAWMDIPENIARKLPRYPIPAALIGRLAVDRRFHRRNFGKYLLFNALDRVVALARQIALFAVVVDAKDKIATEFYAQYGFQPLSNHGLRLLLPLATYVSKT
jgi:predicted GNAT family N-acyltransferase